VVHKIVFALVLNRQNGEFYYNFSNKTAAAVATATPNRLLDLLRTVVVGTFGIHSNIMYLDNEYMFQRTRS
jgi:hypothetical protein